MLAVSRTGAATRAVLPRRRPRPAFRPAREKFRALEVPVAGAPLQARAARELARRWTKLPGGGDAGEVTSNPDIPDVFLVCSY